MDEKSDESAFNARLPLPDYVERYCAFIDILGFRTLVKELSRNRERATFLRTLLSKIHAPPNPVRKSGHIDLIDFQAQSISDAVAISTLATTHGLLVLFDAIENLAVELLKEGYFIRGALVKGMLYHDDKMVFGDALVHAYELESTVVRYPRVMVIRQILQDIERATSGFFRDQRDELMQHISQSDDGPHFVHVLREISAIVAKLQLENINLPPDKQHSLHEFAKMQTSIQTRLNEATDNPRHFEKVQWFARYWHRAVPYGVPMSTQITGPGMDTMIRGDGAARSI